MKGENRQFHISWLSKSADLTLAFQLNMDRKHEFLNISCLRCSFLALLSTRLEEMPFRQEAVMKNSKTPLLAVDLRDY
jgi:hypothetical protein